MERISEMKKKYNEQAKEIRVSLTPIELLAVDITLDDSIYKMVDRLNKIMEMDPRQGAEYDELVNDDKYKLLGFNPLPVFTELNKDGRGMLDDDYMETYVNYFYKALGDAILRAGIGKELTFKTSTSNNIDNLELVENAKKEFTESDADYVINGTAGEVAKYYKAPISTIRERRHAEMKNNTTDYGQTVEINGDIIRTYRNEHNGLCLSVNGTVKMYDASLGAISLAMLRLAKGEDPQFPKHLCV